MLDNKETEERWNLTKIRGKDLEEATDYQLKVWYYVRDKKFRDSIK